MTSLSLLRTILLRPDWRRVREIDAEIDEEFEFHGAMLRRELRENGLSVDDAERAAAERFGDAGRWRAECRSVIKGSRTVIKAAFFCTIVAMAGSYLASQEKEMRKSWAKLAPFSDVRWNQDAPEIERDGRWYALLGVNDVSVAEIMEHCAAEYPGLERKRFSEDLVEVLAGMKQAPGATVDLRVRDLDGGGERVLSGVPLTAENRGAVWTRNQVRSGPGYGRVGGADEAAGDGVGAAGNGVGAAGSGPAADGGGANRVWSRTAPFGAVRWREDVPEIQVDGRWVEVTSVNGVATGEILAYCAEHHSGKERKRFSEDLPDVLREMGQAVGDAVDLGLRDPASGQKLSRFGVALTEENGKLVRKVNREQRIPDGLGGVDARSGAAPNSGASPSGAGASEASAGGVRAGEQTVSGVARRETEWEAYTRRFIEKYKLEEDQTAAAKRLCEQCETEKARYLRKHERELGELRAKVAAGGDGKSRAALAEKGATQESKAELQEAQGATTEEAARLRRRIEELDGPVNAIFERRLKPGLERLPTRRQREAAEKAAKDDSAGR